MHATARTLILALSMSAGLAAASVAQDAGTTPEPAETPASTPAEQTEPATSETPAVSAGDPAAAEEMIQVRDTFDDWEVRCASNRIDCFLYQLARDAQDNPVAEISVIRIDNEGDAKAGVTILTPLGTLLTSGLVLQVDSGEMRRFPFSWCDQAGCFGRLAFDQGSVDEMKRGSKAKLTVFSIAAPTQPITLDISLKGFTAAFNAAARPAE